MGDVIEREISLIEKVGKVFSFFIELLTTIGKVLIGLLIVMMVGLATVKTLELYHNATMEVAAEVSIQQRLL